MGGDYDTPQISSRAIRIPGVMYPPRGSKTQAGPKQCIVSSQLPEGDAQIRPRTGSNPTVTFAIQFKKCWTAGRGPVAGLTKPGYRLTKPDVMPVIFFGTQIAAAPFYPGYSFSQESVSMLGTHFSRHPWMFNYSVCLPHPAEN
jgi:hypothetical protein